MIVEEGARGHAVSFSASEHTRESVDLAPEALVSPLRWATFARLAAAACQAEAGLVVLRQGTRFAVLGASGLAGAVGDLQGTTIFAQALEKPEQIFEVHASPEAPISAQRPYRRFAARSVDMPGNAPRMLIAVLGTQGRALMLGEKEALEVLAQSIGALYEREQLIQLQAINEQPAELVQRLFAYSPEPALVYDRSLPNATPRILIANQAFEHAFALTVHLGDPTPFEALQGERTDQDIVGAIRSAAAVGRPLRATLALYPIHAAQPRWVELWGYPVTLSDGTALWVEQFHDVSDRVQRQTQLTQERGRLQSTLASMADAVITLDAQGHLRFMNQAARLLLDLRGVLPVESLVHADERLLALRDTENEEILKAPFALGPQMHVTKKARALVMTRAGARRYVEYVVSAIERPQAAPDGVVVLLRDVTVEEMLTRQLSFEASHDQLTGIANRRRFDQALARAISSAKQEMLQHTLAFLDLDRFKAINDICGHAAGDQVLREVAQLFKSQLRSHDVIARFGGDEFAILMHDCSPKTASRVINRIRAAISMYRWHWQGHDYSLGVSIGLAEITEQTLNSEEVLRLADAACYADKASHREREGHIPIITGEPATNAGPTVSWTR